MCDTCPRHRPKLGLFDRVALVLFFPFLLAVDLIEWLIECYCHSYGHDADGRGWCRRCDRPVPGWRKP